MQPQATRLKWMRDEMDLFYLTVTEKPPAPMLRLVQHGVIRASYET